jgi:ATP-dependent RNA helicase DDX52/ROK1
MPKTQEDLDKLCSTTEILIASPLKLSTLTYGFPTIDSLQFLVIDEADKMFEMGFLEQVDTVLSNVKNSSNIAKFLFSATMQPAIEELLRNVM